jgi:hypothetical protein
VPSKVDFVGFATVLFGSGVTIAFGAQLAPTGGATMEVATAAAGIRSVDMLRSAVNLAFRWFCKLGIEDAIPDH